jgi:hypothetical protein
VSTRSRRCAAIQPLTLDSRPRKRVVSAVDQNSRRACVPHCNESDPIKWDEAQVGKVGILSNAGWDHPATAEDETRTERSEEYRQALFGWLCCSVMQGGMESRAAHRGT